MTDSYIATSAGGTTFAGPLGVRLYQAIALKSAIRLYAKTGMKANRSYTPTNMLKTAGSLTGKTYKRGQFDQAMTDLAAEIARLETELGVEEKSGQ